MSEYDFNPLEKLIEKRAQGCGHKQGKIWRVFLIAKSGIVLLAAERGTGKTTLVNRLLEAIQEGLDFLGGFKTTKGRCLLIQGDEPKEHAQAVYTQQDLKLNWDVIYPEDQFPVELLLKAVETKQYDAICIDSLTTVLCSEDRRTNDPGLVDLLYKLNRAAVDNGVLILMTAHLIKAPKDGNGVRQRRQTVQWDDIAGLGTIGAAVQDCWGLAPAGQYFSLHALGKRNIKEGTKWLLDREAESFDWWLIDDQEQQLPAVRQRLADKILSHVKQHGYRSVADIAKALGADEEYVRSICVDLFNQGKLQRHRKPSNGPPKRGRPSFVYGVGDFSCITPTPPLNTVPFIAGEDDPAWGPRPEVI